MHVLLPVFCLGALCAAWIALQRWIERSEPGLDKADPCGGCGSTLCRIEKNDPWHAGHRAQEPAHAGAALHQSTPAGAARERDRPAC